MIGTATDLHCDLCHAHGRGRAWHLWCAIEDYHVLQDASRRYEAWMMLFAVRKTPDEKYCDMYRRIEEARNRIVRVTPADPTSRQQFDEIVVARHKKRACSSAAWTYISRLGSSQRYIFSTLGEYHSDREKRWNTGKTPGLFSSTQDRAMYVLTCSIPSSYFPQVETDEWFTHHAAKLPEGSQEDRGLIEGTGCIPLLLRPLLEFKTKMLDEPTFLKSTHLHKPFCTKPFRIRP